MNCVRFQKLLSNSKQVIQVLFFGFMTTALILTACSENMSTSSSPERAVPYTKVNNINANTITSISTIVSPATDLTVSLGEEIYFSASGVDPAGNYPLTYHWDFNRIQPNSLMQNPGFISMNKLGTHKVVLTITNSIGIFISAPETRIIKVTNPNSGNNPNVPVALSPVPKIDSPIGNLNINVGDSLNFRGSATSSDNNVPFNYFWNFAGAVPNSIKRNPGQITFNIPGVYPISLSVTDSLGLMSIEAAMITITVGDIGTTNSAPVATILSPPGDLSIKVGDSLFFTGMASDADVNSILTYNWDFAGAAPNSALSTPGKIVFSAPGTYAVKLFATDSQGLSNLDPPVRIITVADVSTHNQMPLNNVILSPPTDITIDIGASVNFMGEGNDGSLTGPLRYLWHFEGIGMSSSTVQNPGEITFPQTGSFDAKLIIADANGNVVSNKVERKITVIDPNALRVHIHEPATHQMINVGESITFSSMIINDPLGSPTYTYHWQFDGAAPDSIMENPDPVTFNSVGVYEIKLSIQDPLTNRRARANTLKVTVSDPDALQVNIISPLTNQTIFVGDTLNFSGAGVDPLGTAALSYSWKFDGVTPDSNVQNPGNITFNTPGKYKIQLMVTDSMTLRRTRSNIITVTVQDPNALIAEITSPSSDKLLYLGESIDFMGMGADPFSDATMLMYQWEFGRGITSTQQNPGIFTYDTAGDYEVEFHVDDPLTNRHSNKIERRIHVMPTSDPSSVVATIKGIITSPMSNMTIAAGDVVVFEATGFDPSGAALMYHWNFDGSALNTTTQNPGSVMFNMPGIYTITVTVSNAAGDIDASPPSVIITVM